MKHVTFAEYQEAKNEIISGVEYRESSTIEGNIIRKTYATENNGTFYEVNDDGRVEFWSDKHAESRIYDETKATETTPPSKPEAITFCEMYKGSGCAECPNRHVCPNSTTMFARTVQLEQRVR